MFWLFLPGTTNRKLPGVFLNSIHAVFVLLLTVALSADAAAQAPSLKQPAQTPIRQLPTPALAAPRTVPNVIETVELFMKNASAGTIVRFKIGGVSTNNNAKCVVLVNFDRAPSAVHPKPASIATEYTLSTIPTTLETVSMNEGGDWTFHLKPVRECTGKEYVFNFKIAFGSQEVEPVIYGVGVTSMPLWLGTGGQIAILGGGDLKDCKVELSAFGLTLAGPLSAGGTKIISMNSQLLYTEPFTLPLPPNYQKEYKTYQAKLWVKAISGCTVKAPDAEGKRSETVQVWY